MPNKFDRVQVWRFGRRNPPVYVVFFHEGFGSIAGVFGVVVLLKPITVWESLSGEWQQPVGQNLCHVEFSIHDAFEDHQPGRTPFRNSAPNVDFHWMLWSAFYSRLFPFTMESYLAVIFHHNRTFVRENHVVRVSTRLSFKTAGLSVAYSFFNRMLELFLL